METHKAIQELVNSSVLPTEKTHQYKTLFLPFATSVDEIKKQITGLNLTDPTPQDAIYARDIRLQLVKNRTASEKEKDKSKEGLIVESKFIQSLFNTIQAHSKESEDQLMQVEKFAEIKAQKAKDELISKRGELLAPFVESVIIYPLGDLSQEAFDSLLTGAKLAYEQKEKEKALAEKQRQEQEQKEKEERLRMEEENKLLREENAKKEAALLQQKQEQERTAKIEKEKQEKKLKEERLAREKAEAELKAKQEAERREEEEKQAAIEAELAKGDKAKLDDLLNELKLLKTKYNFKSKKHKQIYAGVGELLDKTINWINTKNKNT